MTIEDIKKKVKLVIATPCYGGMVCQNYLISMLKLNGDMVSRGIDITYIIRGGDSLIPRTRNSIVAEFLSKEENTHLLWIDADIGFEVSQIYRLLLADRDVVAGVYPLKKVIIPERVPKDMTREEFLAQYTYYPFNPIKGSSVDEEGFIEVLDAPTGMMLIQRRVLEKMKTAYPGLRYLSDEMLGLEALRNEKIMENHYRFFDVMTEESGRYLSEDYAFVRRWQNIGGKVFVDSRSNLSHQGAHLYTGDFQASMLAHHNSPESNRSRNQS